MQTKGSKQDKRRKIRENDGKFDGKPGKSGGKPDGKPGKPGGNPAKPGGKPNKGDSRIPDLRNFDPSQIIAELSGTLSSNYTYMSKSNTMSIFFASDTVVPRKGFKAVYNIIEG